MICNFIPQIFDGIGITLFITEQLLCTHWGFNISFFAQVFFVVCIDQNWFCWLTTLNFFRGRFYTIPDRDGAAWQNMKKKRWKFVTRETGEVIWSLTSTLKSSKVKFCRCFWFSYYELMHHFCFCLQYLRSIFSAACSYKNLLNMVVMFSGSASGRTFPVLC